MSHIGDIYTAMAAVFNGVSSVGVGYTRPPEVGPKDANLPAAVPDMPEPSEITWGASHDSRVHQLPWVLLVKRDGDLSTSLDVVAPVLEDVLTAFQTNQRLGLSYVYSCTPTGYEIGGYQYGDNSYIGARIMFAVKEKTAVTFS